MIRGFQKCTEICRFLFPSLRYFNFSIDVFKAEISKNDKKTVNLNVRVLRPFST